MKYALFDTNIMIDHLKGKEEATYVLLQCKNNNIMPACSVISEIELLCGMRSGEEAQLNFFLSGFEKVVIDLMIAKSAGLYMNKYWKSHGINMGDAIVAASAKYLGSKLYTLNVKHFPMNDVEIIRPY